MFASRKCFVPGCKTGYKSEQDKNKVLGTKNPSLFKTQEKFIESWKKAIPRADKELTLMDSVCELHFEADDIDKYFEVKLVDGSVFKEPKERPRLKEGAVPRIFPNLPKYISKPSRKRKPPIVRSLLPTKVCHKNPELPGENFCEESFTEESPIQEFTFTYLVKNLNNVLKPNDMWAVSCHPNFVMCAKWTESYAAEKKIIIASDLSIKVFLKEVDAGITVKKPLSVDDVSDTLKITDSYIICAGLSASNCLLTVHFHEGSSGRRSALCINCRKRRRSELASSRYKCTRHEFRPKNWHQRFVNANRRNCRLQEKVEILKRKIKSIEYNVQKATKRQLMLQSACCDYA